MSGRIVLRCGAYPEIDVYKFSRWITDTYFKIPVDINGRLYLDRFDVDITVSIDDEYGRITVEADVVDVSDLDNISEDLKREIRELSRGVGNECKR